MLRPGRNKLWEGGKEGLYTSPGHLAKLARYDGYLTQQSLTVDACFLATINVRLPALVQMDAANTTYNSQSDTGRSSTGTTKLTILLLITSRTGLDSRTEPAEG